MTSVAHDTGHQHGHDHAPGHGHAHGHGHPDPEAGASAFAWAVLLNMAFVVIEFTCGLLANSTALMADAGHNLSDVLGLLLSWAALRLATRRPDARYTYGLRSSTILAALLNAMLLLAACGGIAWEALQRLASPPPVAGGTVTLVALAGLLVNGFSAWLFLRGDRRDLNRRSAWLHLAGDAAVSFGVALAGLLMLATGWRWPDPVISVAIIVVILAGTWGLLRDALRLALSAVPGHLDPAAVAAWLQAQPGVSGIHDLHIWGMSTTESALTVHLVMPGGYPGDAAMDALADGLHVRFGIAHSTLQFELGATTHRCALH